MGGESMRAHQWFLMPSIVFLFCFAFFSSLLAQEKLPAIIKRIDPSIVVILTYDKEGKILAQGSGFFISHNGDIITNRHVLKGASRAEVKTAQGKVYPVTRIVAEDKEGDLIRILADIPVKDVKPLSLSSSIPEVGERIIVIGNPFGLERTVTDGIVSAVREISAFGKIIQITASISSGSSGSPVLNMKGEVIGVATFQIVEGQNLNFAIPGERVAKLTQGKGKTFAEWKAGGVEKWLASTEGLYYTGLVFLWTEDYEKALPYFEKATKKNPRYAEAYLQIGYCNGKLERYTEAIKAFKQAIRIKPDDAGAYYNLGLAYVKLGRYTEAIKAFKQAIRIKPDYANAYYNLGVTYSKLGRYTEAIESYKQAISIKPDYAEAHYNLGVTYSNLRRYTWAIDSYKQAIRIKPDDANAYYGLAWVYGKLGRYTLAIASYKQAIHIKPDYAEAYYNLGWAYGELGRYKEEIESYKQAVRIKPDYAEAHCNLGVTYFELGRYTEAIESYKQAIRIKPDYAEAHYNLGLAYFELGRYTEAIKAFKQAIHIKPDYADAYCHLGLAYNELGHYIEAIKALKQAMRIKKTDDAKAH
jgi:tetratricopeptide (TPR) repeat protein